MVALGLVFQDGVYNSDIPLNFAYYFYSYIIFAFKEIFSHYFIDFYYGFFIEYISTNIFFGAKGATIDKYESMIPYFGQTWFQGITTFPFTFLKTGVWNEDIVYYYRRMLEIAYSGPLCQYVPNEA